MKSPQEYAQLIAQMMLQSAQAEGEEIARREEMEFRRQQARDALDLQRQNLDLARTESTQRMSLARSQEEREQKEFDRKREDYERSQAEIEAASTLAENPDAPLGAGKLADSVSGRTKLLALQLRGESAKAKADIARAEAAPEELKLGRRKDELAIKAYEQQIADADARKAHDAAMRDLTLAEAKKRDVASDMELSNKRMEAEKLKRDLVARRLGLRTEDEIAAANEMWTKLKITGVFESASNAATTIDQFGNKKFDDNVYNDRIRKGEEAMMLAGQLGSLSVRSPDIYRKLQSDARIAVTRFLDSGGKPSDAINMVRSMAESVFAATKPRGEKDGADKKPPPAKTESERRLILKESQAKDVENRIVYSIQETIKELPDDLVAKLESKYGGDMEKIVEAIRKNLPADGKTVPSNERIAAAARVASGWRVGEFRNLQIK